jgi:tripartite-type tricarboxylate transporter receptor subunit TctC
MTIRICTLAGLTGGLLLASPLAFAQAARTDTSNFPTRPIRIIIPYAPGGASDNIGRIVIPRLAEALKQNIVIDNRAGGAGSIGRDLGAKAVPDGYTLLTTDAPHVINPHLLRKLPYDPLRDFTPIATTATSTMVMVVNPNVPAKTVGELIALAKSQPGKLNFGSGGNGAITHLSGELFKLAANVNIVHVPYKSISFAVTDVIANQIPIAFPGTATVTGHVRAGRLRLLAVAGNKRVPSFPDTPTFTESGVPGMVAQNWFGIMGPAKLPAAIVQRIEQETIKAIRSADINERLVLAGIEPMPGTAGEFATLLATEYVRWGKVVKAAGLKPE